MRMVTPNGATLLALAVVCYAVGVAGGYSVFVGVAAGGAALLAIAAVLVVVRPRVAVRRTVVPDRATVGETVLGRLVAISVARLVSPGFVVIDRIGDRTVEVAVGPLQPGARKTIHYPIQTDRRGRLTLGPLTVERRDPLGLFRLAQQRGGQDVLWVHPRVHALRPLPVGDVLDYEGRVSDPAPRGSVTFSSLREYEPGDDPRRIHWKSTARRGLLMVKEHVDTSEPRTTVVLDTRVEIFEAGTFNEAVELAASVVVASERTGHPVALHVLGEDADELRRAGARTVLDRFAAAETRAGDVVGLLDTVERAEPGGGLVVITGVAEPMASARLSAQRRRFGPVVVVEVGGQGAAGGAGPVRRPGMAVLRARTAAEGVRLWNQYVTGARS